MSRYQALRDRLSAVEAQLSVVPGCRPLPNRSAVLRHDATDQVSPVLQQLLAEVLPGATVLDWRQEGLGHAGRMAADGLIFRFRVDAAGVGYRPAWDGLGQRGWELRSDSFLQLRAPTGHRLDFRRTAAPSAQKRKCTTGYSCGSSCISLQKECRIAPGSAIGKARLRRLQQLAAGGDATARATAQEVQAARGTAAVGRLKERNTKRVEKLLARPEIAEYLRTGKLPQPASASTEPGTVRNMTPGDIVFDPGRFQYKLNATEGTGEVGSLSGVRKWDPNLAGVMSVWKDPADDKVYVVNGHNRLSLARRLGAEEVTVRFLNAANATEARAIGAMQNIAEGAGTPMDAAKFFRDTGIKSQADVEARGLPLGSGQAEKGLRLSKLPGDVFNAVVRGDLTVNRGAIIGGSGLDEAKQREVFKMVSARKGIADQTLLEMVEHAAASEQRTQTTMSLFGETQEAKDNLITRAKLSAALKSKIAREKRLFTTVSKAKAATTLQQKGGNVINQEQSAKVAGEASEALEVFKRLKSSSGPISSALNRAADRVEAGEPEGRVRQELEQEVFAAVEQELVAVGLRKRPRADAVQERIATMKRLLKPAYERYTGRGEVRNVNQKDSGEGEPCGNGWIDPNDTCRKGNATTNNAQKGPQEKLSRITKSRFTENTNMKRQVVGVVQLEEPVQVYRGKYVDKQGVEQDHFIKANDATYSVTAKDLTSGYGDLKENVSRATGIDLSDSKVWDIAFETGLGSGGRDYNKNPEMPREAAKKIATAIRVEIDQIIGNMPDNTVITCNPWTKDGLGGKRRSLYERAGFYSYGERGAMVALVRGGRIVKPSGLSTLRKDSADTIDLERLIYQLLTMQSQPTLDGSKLMQRIDAIRRRIEAPGQLGLNLGASPSAGGKGTGEPCGQGWISRDKDCHKEGGEPVDDRPIGQRNGIPLRQGSESDRPLGADSSTSLARRVNDARRRLVSTIAETGGLDEKTADLVADFYLAKPKDGGLGVASLDPHIGQFNIKHGMFMDREAINHAVAKAMQYDAGRQRAQRRKGFLSGLSPMARGKAEKALEVMVRNSRSGYVTRQELVEERVTEGFAPITTAKGERRLANSDGVFLTLRDVTTAGMDYAGHLISSRESKPVLSNPGRQDPGMAPKAKEQGINAQDVTTSSQQSAFARQQQQAARAAGDQRGAQAWRKEERTVERNRLSNAIATSKQSQTALFGVTEYDESMPLFQQQAGDPGPRRRRDAEADILKARIDALRMQCTPLAR